MHGWHGGTRIVLGHALACHKTIRECCNPSGFVRPPSRGFARPEPWPTRPKPPVGPPTNLGATYPPRQRLGGSRDSAAATRQGLSGHLAGGLPAPHRGRRGPNPRRGHQQTWGPTNYPAPAPWPHRCQRDPNPRRGHQRTGVSPRQRDPPRRGHQRTGSLPTLPRQRQLQRFFQRHPPAGFPCRRRGPAQLPAGRQEVALLLL